MKEGLPFFRRQNHAHKGNLVKYSSILPLFKISKNAFTVEKIQRFSVRQRSQITHLVRQNRVTITLRRLIGHSKSGVKKHSIIGNMTVEIHKEREALWAKVVKSICGFAPKSLIPNIILQPWKAIACLLCITAPYLKTRLADEERIR